MKEKEVWYVAMSRCYWGRGHTAEEAKENLFKEGATKIEPRIIKKLPDGATDPWVDEMGCICWEWEDGGSRTGSCEIVEKKGF